MNTVVESNEVSEVKVKGRKGRSADATPNKVFFPLAKNIEKSDEKLSMNIVFNDSNGNRKQQKVVISVVNDTIEATA